MVLASAGVRGQAERTGGLQLPPDALQAVVQARERPFVSCLLEPTEANATTVETGNRCEEGRRQ